MLVVVEQPASTGALPPDRRTDTGCPVVHISGLTRRRIAGPELLQGQATGPDPRDRTAAGRPVAPEGRAAS